MLLSLFLATTLTVSSPTALRRAIDDLGATGGTIELTGDNWHFRNQDARELSFFISNHDQSKSHRVNLPIVGVTNLVVRGTGQTLTFENPSIGIYIRDSQNITFQNLKLDWEKPYLTDVKIVGFDAGGTIIEAPYLPKVIGETMIFDGKTRAIIPRSADILVPQPFKSLGNNTYRIAKDFSRIGAGGKIGDTICLRPDNRRFPACVVDRSKNVKFKDFIIHSAGGMGIVAQMSENLAWVGSKPAATRTSGVCVPAGTARVTTLHADAFHLSNCKGKILVKNGFFETMMDDALNVHSTCMSIVEKRNENTIKCRYKHYQAYGFDVFNTGDTVRFIKGQTLENGAELKLKNVQRLGDWELLLTFETPIPPLYGVGDVVENADYQPAVLFKDNIVTRNRARGILLTTPKKCVVEGNLFDSVAGAAILFAGDAQGWYESGACEDVWIQGNTFRNCMTSRFQFCEAVISSYPMVKDLPNQKVPYHKNIRVKNNVFENNHAPLLFKISTEPLIWEDNSHEI